MTVSINSSIDTTPSIKASCNSSVLTYPIALATCFNCPGIAVIKVRHSIISGLPLEYACIICSNAAVWFSIGAPPAIIALFTAKNISVERSISSFLAVKRATAEAPASNVVGSPLSFSLNLFIDFSLCSVDIPKDFIVLGKAFNLSNLSIASPVDELTIFQAVLNALVIPVATRIDLVILPTEDIVFCRPDVSPLKWNKIFPPFALFILSLLSIY